MLAPNACPLHHTLAMACSQAGAGLMYNNHNIDSPKSLILFHFVKCHTHTFSGSLNTVEPFNLSAYYHPKLDKDKLVAKKTSQRLLMD